MKKQFLEIGKIVSTHGIKGEMRMQAWCDDPAMLGKMKVLYLDGGKEEFKISSAKVHKNIVILKIKGVDDIDTANTYRNKILFANRNQFKLGENDYFIQDLIGMTVLDADNESICYGKIIDVTETGANDVYHIKDDEGKIKYAPAIAKVVIDTDIDNGIMKIRPLEGLFDD